MSTFPSTMSSQAAAESAQLRLFLSQQNQSNGQLSRQISNQSNNQFDDWTKSNNEFDLNDQASNSTYDDLINQAIKQSMNFIPSIPQYSVTSDFYPNAQNVQNDEFSSLTEKKYDDFSVNQSNNQSEFSSKKRSYEDYLPPFTVNKRTPSQLSFSNQSGNTSFNNSSDFLKTERDGVDYSNELMEAFFGAAQNVNQPGAPELGFSNDEYAADVTRLSSFNDQSFSSQSLVQSLSSSLDRFSSNEESNPSHNSPVSGFYQHSILTSPTPPSLPGFNERASPSLVSSPHSSVSTISRPSVDVSNISVSSLTPAGVSSSSQTASSTAKKTASQSASQTGETTPFKGDGSRRMKRRMTDKQRRAKIKDGLEHLRTLVSLHGDSSTDQASVVQQSINLIKQLINQTKTMQAELNRYKEEGVRLSIQLQAQVQAAQHASLTQNSTRALQSIVQAATGAGANQRDALHQSVSQLAANPNLQSLLADAASNPAISGQLPALLQLVSALTNNQSSPTGGLDNIILSSYLLQTIQILSQLPINRLSQ